MKLELPYPPSVNHYWRYTSRGLFVGKRGKRYRVDVRAAILQQCGLVKPLEGSLSVSVDLYPPDRRKRDLDNPMKALLDSLAHAGIYGDDCQVDVLCIRRQFVTKGGLAVVIVETLEGE